MLEQVLALIVVTGFPAFCGFEFAPTLPLLFPEHVVNDVRPSRLPKANIGTFLATHAPPPQALPWNPLTRHTRYFYAKTSVLLVPSVKSRSIVVFGE